MNIKNEWKHTRRTQSYTTWQFESDSRFDGQKISEMTIVKIKIINMVNYLQLQFKSLNNIILSYNCMSEICAKLSLHSLHLRHAFRLGRWRKYRGIGTNVVLLAQT